MEIQFGPLRARNSGMRELLRLLPRVAGKDAAVLLEGEKGTGKQTIARAIHDASGRASGPFVTIDCQAIDPDEIAVALFGFEPDATEPALARPGAYEAAHGGTLFLKEVSALPRAVQHGVLRALERREVRRVGGAAAVAVDVRMIAATSRSLGNEVWTGRFRCDLYYALNVVHMRVPPLRQRIDDLPILVEDFLRKMGHAGTDVLSEADWRALRKAPWPRNLPELRERLERVADEEAESGNMAC